MQNLNSTVISSVDTRPSTSIGKAISSLTELVTRQIRELVITGEFVPGQQLKEDELCRMFDVSRPPIREAFKILEANGLLVHKPRKGVFVADLTFQDVEEVYTIIAMFYHKTTDIALKVITESDIDVLKRHLDRMVHAVGAVPHNVREYQHAHSEFHQVLIDIAGNSRIKKLEKELREQVFIFSYASFRDEGHLKASIDYHIRIYEAIRERNKEKALQLMEEHVLKAIDFLGRHFRGTKS